MAARDALTNRLASLNRDTRKDVIFEDRRRGKVNVHYARRKRERNSDLLTSLDLQFPNKRDRAKRQSPINDDAHSRLGVNDVDDLCHRGTIAAFDGKVVLPPKLIHGVALEEEEDDGPEPHPCRDGKDCNDHRTQTLGRG